MKIVQHQAWSQSLFSSDDDGEEVANVGFEPRSFRAKALAMVIKVRSVYIKILFFDRNKE